MKRRSFLQGSVVAGVGAAAGCKITRGPSVHTGQRVRWELASSFPRALDTLFGGATVLAERVREMTGGRFEINVTQGGELVPALQVMDATQQGAIQAAQTASYYFIGKNPALAFDCCVPFGMTARQQAAWLHEGGGLQMTREIFSDFNIVNFPGGNTGTQMGGWFKREVNSLSEMQGLKMRIPGMGGVVMNRIGVAAQTIAGGEIYTALETGAIDAAEWVGPYDDAKLGFHKVARFYYYPGWWEPGPSLSFYFNKDAYNSLSAEYKAILGAAAKDAENTMLARYDAKNPKALADLLKEGVQMRPFSNDVMEAAHKESKAMLEENAAANAQYAKIYASWKKAKSHSFKWFNQAEAAYAQFAYPKE